MPMTVDDIKRDQAKATAPEADSSDSVAAAVQPSGTVAASIRCQVRGEARHAVHKWGDAMAA